MWFLNVSGATIALVFELIKITINTLERVSR